MESSSTTCSDDLERLQTLKQYLQTEMVADRPDLYLKPIRTKQEKCSFKGLSKDVSVNSSSSEYYANSPVAVPFRWESRPGTPKTLNGESLIPPLSPPPSLTQSPARKHVKKQPKSNTLLQNVLSFGKRSPRYAPPQHFEPHPSSYKLSPASYSAPSSPYKPSSRAEIRQPSCTTSSESRTDSGDYESASVVSCFSFGRRLNARSCGPSPHPSFSFTQSRARKKPDSLKALPKE